MKPTAKNKIANSLGSNHQLNRIVLNMKTSWDKVETMLKNTTLPKKKPKK